MLKKFSAKFLINKNINKLFSKKAGQTGKFNYKLVFIFPDVNVDEFSFNEVNTNGKIL
jgi:hypothetical protein